MRRNNKTTKLWPIIEPDPRLPLPPVAWHLLNLIAVISLGIPYYVAVSAYAVGLWLANELQLLLIPLFTPGAAGPTIIADTIKLLLSLMTLRLAVCLVPSIPYIARETRDAMREYIES
jgi:hypothetical protein